MQTSRPIIMSSPMVLGLIANRKLQTRRTRGLEAFTNRGQLLGYGSEKGRWGARFGDSIPDDPVPIHVPCPYGKAGDKLYVREGVRQVTESMLLDQVANDYYDPKPLKRQHGAAAEYIADGEPAPIDHWTWKNKALPAIHMPFGVRRFELELTQVRVERVQAINEADAQAEGLEPRGRGWAWPGEKRAFATAVEAYRAGWEWLNGEASWAQNPWVWVLTFAPRRIQ